MSNKLKIFLVLSALVIFYIYRVELGIMALNVFLFMDSLLHLSEDIPPVFMWVALGALIGLIFGSFVAWKKYRLDFKLNLIPIGLLILFVIILMSINQPLSSMTAISEARTADAYRFITVRASSSLPRYKSNTYDETNLLDTNNNTAWIENGKYAGVGDRIEFSFSTAALDSVRNLRCIGLRLKNGFNKSEKLWKDYNRIMMFYVYHKDQFVATLTARDLYNQWEEFRISPLNIVRGDVLSIRISSVYPGRKRAARTAITELVPIVEYRAR